MKVEMEHRAAALPMGRWADAAASFVLF